MQMKFNIYFTLHGPAGDVEAPNTKNPVECDSLSELLVKIAPNLINNEMVQTIGIRIEEAK